MTPVLLFDCVGLQSCQHRVKRGLPLSWHGKLGQYDVVPSSAVDSFCFLLFPWQSMVLTLKLSHLLSERDKLITLLVASFVFEYHMRAPSERRTIVAFSVISSTWKHIVQSIHCWCMALPSQF